MTHSQEQYTPENCRLVGEWLEGEEGYACWENDKEAQRHFIKSKEVPQLLREALAAEGWDVDQDSARHNLGLCQPYKDAVTVNWYKAEDPTARHALFAAVVEYLKTKD